MRVEAFKELDQAARSAVDEDRLRFVADCRTRTTDTLLLAGLDRIEAMIRHKWKTKNAATFKEISKKSKRASQNRTITAGASKRGAHWTAQDEAEVMRSTETDEELAIRLGRTLKGVRQKRNQLRKVLTRPPI